MICYVRMDQKGKCPVKVNSENMTGLAVHLTQSQFSTVSANTPSFIIQFLSLTFIFFHQSPILVDCSCTNVQCVQLKE